MVFKKIIFQNRYVELETPAPFMEKIILNFHFDYLNPSLTRQIGSHLGRSRGKRTCNMAPMILRRVWHLDNRDYFHFAVIFLMW